MLKILLVAKSWHWYIKQPRIAWSQMKKGLILLYIRDPELERLFPAHVEDLLGRDLHHSTVLQHGSHLPLLINSTVTGAK